MYVHTFLLYYTLIKYYVKIPNSILTKFIHNYACITLFYIGLYIIDIIEETRTIFNFISFIVQLR